MVVYFFFITDGIVNLISKPKPGSSEFASNDASKFSHTIHHFDGALNVLDLDIYPF